MHIVVITWRKDVTADQIKGLDAALANLPNEVPHLLSYTFGANLHLREPGGDYAVCAVVAAADLDKYLDHPAHVDVVQRHLANMIGTRSAAQIRVAPALAQLIQRDERPA